MYLLVKFSGGPVESVGCVGFLELKGVECICLLIILLGLLEALCLLGGLCLFGVLSALGLLGLLGALDFLN